MTEHTSKLTGIPLFDGTNFNNWRFPANAKEKDKIKANEKKCKNIIVQSVHDCQLENIKDEESSKDMIDGLASIYEWKGISTKLLLKRELLLMKYQKGEDMKDHLVKFDTKIRELKSAGAKMEEDDIVVHLLLTLPDAYDNLITAIGTIDQSRVTLEIVKSHVSDEYNKKSVGSSNGKAITVAMNANITCFGCGQVGHVKSQCKAKKKGKKSMKLSKKNDSEKNSANTTESSKEVASLSAICERAQYCLFLVAMGAAILAANLDKKDDLAPLLLRNVTPLSIGLLCQDRGKDRVVRKVIKRNTVYPIEMNCKGKTVTDKQDKFFLAIFEGEHENPAHNIKLGSMNLKGIKVAAAGHIISYLKSII